LNSHGKSILKPFILATLINGIAMSYTLFIITHGRGIIIWLPTGCALATLLIFGLRFWASIALGISIASLAMGLTLIYILGMVLSTTLAALIAAYLLLRFNFNSALERGWDLFFLVLAAIAYSTVGPLIALIGKYGAGLIPWTAFGSQWMIILMGDITSLLVVVPAVLIWRKPGKLVLRKHGWRLLEAGLLTIALVGCTLYFINRDFREAADFYVFFPLLIWAGLRFGRHGATGAIFLVLLCLSSSYSSRFAFGARLTENVLSLQMAISVVTVAILILAVIVSERRQVEKKLKELNDQLEQRVTERTRSLTKEISERQRIEAALRESEESYRSIVENSVDGILLLDKEGYILEWNRGVEKIFGLKKTEVIRRRIWDTRFRIIADEEKTGQNYQYYQNYFSQLFTGELSTPRRTSKITIEQPNGIRRLIQGSLFFIEANQRLLLCGVIRDITEQESMADEILKYNQRLKVLHEIDHGILEAKSLEKMMESTLPNLGRLMNSRWTCITLFDDEGWNIKALRIDAGGKMEWSSEKVFHFHLNQWEMFKELKQGNVVLQSDLSAVSVSLVQKLQAEGLNTLLYVPLILQENLNGVICLGSKEMGAFDAEYIEMAKEVVREIAVFVRQSRLTDQIKTQREEMRQLAQCIVIAQEEERRRLSRELHDEAGQALTALKIGLELTARELPLELLSVRERLVESTVLVDATMEQLRSLARGLRPPALDTIGLNYTLDDLCRDFAKRSHIAVEYRGEDLPFLSDAVKICFYRILQESLTNVYKHSEAKHVTVTLRQDPKSFSLIIQDDGRGFRQIDKKRGTTKGIGLLGMEERLMAVGGKLTIQSQAGQGTQLIARIFREESD
jgi:PAS domain S-box-containing protein